MLTQIDRKEWEETCRAKTGLGFETFKTITHCDAETLDALLEAAPGSIKGTMYFDWLMECLSLAQSGKTTEDAKAAFQTPLTEREQLLFRILSLKSLFGSLHNRVASIEMLAH